MTTKTIETFSPVCYHYIVRITGKSGITFDKYCCSYDEDISNKPGKVHTALWAQHGKRIEDLAKRVSDGFYKVIDMQVGSSIRVGGTHGEQTLIRL